MTDVLNPVSVEHAIREVADSIAKGVRIVSDRYSDFLNADRAYDQAFARAYMAQDGPAHERKYAAELATAQERQARDVADVAYQYARSTARALEDKLRAYQSVNASIRTAYGVAGVGER
jgi:hypothetical protein